MYLVCGSRLALHVCCREPAANEEARESDTGRAVVRVLCTAYARGRTVSAYFRNHLTSERRAYFRLAGQLSQLCAQTLHIFAYYPRTAVARWPCCPAAYLRSTDTVLHVLFSSTCHVRWDVYGSLYYSFPHGALYLTCTQGS